MNFTKTQAAGLSVFSNLALTLFKLAVGIISGSMSIIAEAAHSGVDLIASFIAYFSVRVSDRPPDHDHPYGHSKIENISGVLEASLIFIVSVWIVFEAVHKLRIRAEVTNLPAGIAIMTISLVANIVVSRVLYRIARQTRSIALEADAAHLWSDVLTSGGVMATLAAIYVGRRFFDAKLYLLDPIFSMIIAVWILGIAYRLIVKSYPALMDERADEGMEAQLRGIIKDFCGDRCRYHKLRTRQAGPLVHVDFHLQFVPDTHIEDAHRFSHSLKKKIQQEISGSEVIIHLEPYEDDAEELEKKNERKL
jgi:cation diffusion facilitator family transporter